MMLTVILGIALICGLTTLPVQADAYNCPVHGDPQYNYYYCYTADSLSGWQGWGAWGSCDHTCGGGIRIRTRVCRQWRSYFNFNGVYRCSNLYAAHSENDQSSCQENCLNHGIYINGRCQCKAGMKGLCCEVVPICRPVCENNGTCIADDTCNCLPGYYGHRCEKGGNLNELLLPKLHPALPVDDLYQPLSWYDSPDYDSSNQVCFVKVLVQNVPYDTILTAESSAANKTTNPFGNFTAGPIDSSAKTNGSSRFACLQIRCPGTYTIGEEFDVIVNVSVETGFKRCHIRNRNGNLMALTVSSTLHGSDTFSIVLENGNNYGPSYGSFNFDPWAIKKGTSGSLARCSALKWTICTIISSLVPSWQWIPSRMTCRE